MTTDAQLTARPTFRARQTAVGWWWTCPHCGDIKLVPDRPNDAALARLAEWQVLHSHGEVTR